MIQARALFSTFHVLKINTGLAFMDLTLLFCEEPGDWFSPREVTPADPPPWLIIDHPEFPKYFNMTVVDHRGAILYSYQRLAEGHDHSL